MKTFGERQKGKPSWQKLHYLVLANLKSSCPKQWNQVVVVLSSRFESQLHVPCFLEHNALITTKHTWNLMQTSMQGLIYYSTVDPYLQMTQMVALLYILYSCNTSSDSYHLYQHKLSHYMFHRLHNCKLWCLITIKDSWCVNITFPNSFFILLSIFHNTGLEKLHAHLCRCTYRARKSSLTCTKKCAHKLFLS